MQRYLYRAQYTYDDGTSSYEPVCVRAATEAAALIEVTAATARYPTAIGATRTITLTLVTADV
jgi:hypothetical protein